MIHETAAWSLVVIMHTGASFKVVNFSSAAKIGLVRNGKDRIGDLGLLFREQLSKLASFLILNGKDRIGDLIF
jgi:hypothetical protein